MTFTPSKYQRAFFDWIKKGEGSAIVDAGSGFWQDNLAR